MHTNKIRAPVYVEDKTYTGPGKRYHTNLWDVLRDAVDTTKTGVDELIGKR